MSVTIKGLPQLHARLNAIQNGRALLGKLQIDAVAEAKRLAPHRTSNLSRSIIPGSLTDHDALVVAHAGYARYVEEGTGLYGPHHQKIVPKNGKFLVFPAKGKATLGGRVKREYAGKPGSLVFARSVKGSKPQPFLVPGAKKAVATRGASVVVDLWNEAA